MGSEEKAAYRLFVIGCAECRGWSTDEGLVEQILAFPTTEAAKQYVADQGVRPSWAPHPLGGEFYGTGSGDWWIVPVAALLDVNGSGDKASRG